MKMAVCPFGFWKSPITSEMIVGDTIRLDAVALDGEDVYWTESQPQKQGRYFVYHRGADGLPEPVTPDDASSFNVRTRVHEYGGGAFTVDQGIVYFSNFSDQRLYRQSPGMAPQPITPGSTGPAATDVLRYADGVIDRRRRRMICVREDHTGSGQAVNVLASVDLSGGQPPQVLVSGNDFYSTPRL